ncbi:FAD:protein FMN transferase [Desulfofustis limnaeus]|uniref:FAD:protein FMN transferase n=1 Tax=Desulfofustis limnaeus TaxID=2740163 RepID=UPI0024E0270B|nr:FAD:protein FMN transferase [Desulfofustis limnaeus]
MITKQTSCNSRRRLFLKYSGLLGLGSVAGSLLPVEHAEALLFHKKEYKVSNTRLAMGTYVAMTAIHPSRDQAEEAFGRAFAEIERLSKIFSRYDASSPVTELNHSGRLKGMPVEMQEVLDRASEFHRQTDGMFDITVSPIVDLYRHCRADGREPKASEIEQALQLVDSTGLKMKDGTIRFSREGMGITLDGIAKGYIVDRASQVLIGQGIDNHLINAGGDIKTSGSAARGRKWTIAVQDPRKERAYPDIIEMGTGAIATSGNYEVYYDREKVFHHIVNGRSGYSPLLSASVSVIASSVLEADALSTAVFVYEPDLGLNFMNQRPHCECLIVQRDGQVRTSAGWYG